MRIHQHVVVGYDFSQSATAALERAIALASRAPSHVLHFLCVIEPHRPVANIALEGKVDAGYAERVQEALSTEVELQLALAETDAQIQYFVHARIGKPADEILDLARDVGADLVIVGSKGIRGLERWIVGSISEHVVRDADCTVEVARPKAYRDVELLPMIEVEQDHRPYIPPHRYSYEERRVNMRPPEWPLY